VMRADVAAAGPGADSAASPRQEAARVDRPRDPWPPVKNWHVTAFDIDNDLVDKQTWILSRTERDVNRAPVVVMPTTPRTAAQLDRAFVRSHHAMVSHTISDSYRRLAMAMDSVSAPPGG
jgi:hypothetical protein